ncbi:MAG: hypothetical protein ACKVT2_15560 [Saprospiraceae bacterium]
MKNIAFLTMLLLVLGFWSCKLDESTELQSAAREASKFPDFLELNDLGRQKWDGFIAIRNQKGFGDIKNSAYSASFHLQDQALSEASLGQLFIGSHEFTKVGPTASDFSISGNQLHELFGKESTISFGAPGTDRDEEEGSLYVPDPIVVTSPSHSMSGPNNLSGNVSLSWNVDPENTLGVFVIIEFNPWDIDNNTTFGQTISAGVKRAFVTEDDGSHTFSLSDMGGIPSNAKIRISLVRGNFTNLDAAYANGEDLSLVAYCYTMASAKFTKI